MNILDTLKGKKIMVETDMGVSVELEIKEVKEEHHSEDLEPATPANDWWPPSRNWTNYRVIFTTGKSKVYNSLTEINFY